MFIYANILKQTWGPIYCYLFDKAKGSGKVHSISVKELAIQLNKSKRTINRLLQNNPAFRKVIRHKTGNKSNGYITIYLKSWRKIRDEIKLDLGPRFEGDLDCLNQNKYYCVLAHALSLQAKSFYACKKQVQQSIKLKRSLQNTVRKNANKTKEGEYKDTFTPFTLSPLKFFKTKNKNSKNTKLEKIQSSPKVQGQLFRSNKSSFTNFFMSSSFYSFGASNETIARESDFSTRRVISLLKKASKVGIYHFDPKYYKEQEEAKYIDSEEKTNNSAKYYRFGSFIYKRMPNIYYPLLDLCGGNKGNTNRKFKYLKSKSAFAESTIINRRTKKSEISSQNKSTSISG
jgi:hypothetical protein